MASATSSSFTTGVKGSDVHSTTGSPLLDLSVMLNRGLTKEVIQGYVDRIVATASSADLEDLFVLAFQTRDIRGGKGERDLFTHLFTALRDAKPVVAHATLDLVPEYGCWRDLFSLTGVETQRLVRRLAVAQLIKDEVAIATRPSPEEMPKLSLVAKWMPREHSNKDATTALARLMASELCPRSSKPQAEYRKRVAAVNKVLNTVETTMCGGSWADIEPSHIPGRALAKYRAAFLNQPVNGQHGRKTPSTKEDRVICEKHFREHFAKAAKGDAKVHGSDTVFPHELVSRVIRGEGRTADERNAIQAQWRAIVDSVRKTGALDRTLAMCDFSGSMSGTPMDVSMALGCLISEVNTGVFANHILTFDSTPTLHKFRSTDLVDRVKEVVHLAQGTSTDFQAAYNLVLSHLKANAVTPGSEPKDLIVLTDMGFDQATRAGGNGRYSGSRHVEAVKTKEQETHVQIARRAFKLAGEQLFGEGNGWSAPRLIIWNLRAEYADFQATAAEEGVVQVSGWSPSLLKVLTTRGADSLTPDAMLRAMLEDPRYDAVRNRVRPLLATRIVDDDDLGRLSYWGC
jgi:Domain of unknown function (DUF2828)